MSTFWGLEPPAYVTGGGGDFLLKEQSLKWESNKVRHKKDLGIRKSQEKSNFLKCPTFYWYLRKLLSTARVCLLQQLFVTARVTNIGTIYDRENIF